MHSKTEDFIKSLDEHTSIRVGRTISLLESTGHLLDMPDSKSLGKGLFELRTHGKKQIRILYMFKDNKAYILHGFIKKTWKISRNDIKYARLMQREVEALA